MNTQDDIIIDTMEAGTQPDPSLTEAVVGDADMTESCREVMAAARQLRKAKERVDVEERLRRFKLSAHKQQGENATGQERQESKECHYRQDRLRIMGLSLLAAAAVAALVIMTTHLGKKDPSLVFQAQNHDTEITIDGTTAAPEAYSSFVSDKGKGGRICRIEAKRLDKEATVTIPYGREAIVCLPDGSLAHLHPGSRLTFPNAFLGDTREVYLEGEAYFDVTHDADHPFIVNTKHCATRVLGTEFDVTAYADRPACVTLVSGHVEVGQPGGKPKRILPGQSATVETDGSLSVRQADTEPFTMWRDGFLYFDNVSLEEILKEIGRQFNINVRCHTPNAAECRMRFFVRRDASLKEVVETINMMQQAQASITADGIVVD